MESKTAKTRIQALRRRKLKADERNHVDDVERHGCHIIHVREEGNLPGWSYTVGLYETFHQPEIIVIGLKIDTAQYLLNEIADRFKGGFQIQEGLRQTDLLENVEYEFKRVEEPEELKAIASHPRTTARASLAARQGVWRCLLHTAA